LFTAQLGKYSKVFVWSIFVGVGWIGFLKIYIVYQHYHNVGRTTQQGCGTWLPIPGQS